MDSDSSSGSESDEVDDESDWQEQHGIVLRNYTRPLFVLPGSYHGPELLSNMIHREAQMGDSNFVQSHCLQTEGSIIQ